MAWVRGAPIGLVFLGLVGLAGLTLSGCESDLAGAFGGPAVAATTARPVQVFVASTRKAEHGAASQALSSDGVHYALDILTIPPVHHAGSIEEPMFGSANAREHIVLSGERTLDADEFKSELASHVSGRIGVNRDVLVFVHGFNTPFDEARDRTAQIVADSRFGGVAILFTWPTKHELFGYVSDKDNATASRDALQTLLQEIGATPGIGKVHVLAHSMGGWLAMEALRQEAIAGDRDLSGHLGEVMLASPDIDLDVFAGQMARLRPASVTVLATANDRALSLSSAIAQSRQRVGGINPSKPEDRLQGCTLIDVGIQSLRDHRAESGEVLAEEDVQVDVGRGEHHIAEMAGEVAVASDRLLTQRLHRQPSAHRMGEHVHFTDAGRRADLLQQRL